MEPLIKVERFIHKPDWTLSRIFVKGKLFCYAIEDEYRDKKVFGETRIPDGTYELGFRISPKFSKEYVVDTQFNLGKRDFKNKYPDHEMMWVKNVPGFEFILIHWGNTDDDSHGCLIVGSSIGVLKGQDAVLDSRKAYIKLYKEVMPLIKSGGQTIKYYSI